MEGNFNSDSMEIERVYIIPFDFFNEPGFKERLQNEINSLRISLRTEEREEVKSKVNLLSIACQNNLENPHLKEYSNIAILDFLTDYGQHFSNSETFQNIINFFEKDNNKEIYFNSFKFFAKKIYATSYLQLYNIHHVNFPYDVSKESIEWLLKSKFILLSTYKSYLEGEINLSDLELGGCLELLSSCLVQLSRWFESLYYIRLIENKKIDSANGPYMKVHTLDVISKKTCMTFNDLLFLSIVDAAQLVIKSKRSIPQQKAQMINYQSEYRKKIKSGKTSIGVLRKHKQKIKREQSQLSHYDKFIADHNLFLNEHSYFCYCNASATDSLKIETSHEHTKNEIAKENEKIIELLKNEFVIARKAFFQSQFPNEGQESNIASHENLKYAYIKNSFKNCYSILDVIGNSILKILNINVPENQRRRIYFTTIWGTLITEEHFKDHFYLISLYSIAKDLDNAEFSALKTYKNIRNAFEHKIVHVIDENPTTTDTEYEQYFNFIDLVKKTELLLTLTKSAIISFTYFVRKETKRIEKSKSNDKSQI